MKYKMVDYDSARREHRITAQAKRRAHQDHLNEIHAQNQAIVTTGICPVCDAKLKQNLSLTGWWQCEQFGAMGFRKDSSKPCCEFQCFTE
jgi:hypothetical protein